MNLRETSSLIKSLVPFLGFLLLVILVFVWWNYFRVIPAEEKFGVLGPPEATSVLYKGVELASSFGMTNAPSMPKVLDVYDKSAELQKNKIAEKLGFKSEPKSISGQLVWQEGTNSLVFKLPSTQFSFANTQAVKDGKLSKEEAINEAGTLIKNLGLVSDPDSLTVEDVGYLLISGGDVYAVSSGENFNVYSVIFGRKLGRYNLVDKSSNSGLINVWIGKDGSLKKILADSQPLEFIDKSTYKIKPLRSAQNEVREGKATVVGVGSELSNPKKLAIVYSQVEIAYFFSGATEKYFQPVYVFKGSAFSQYQGAVEVTAILPAIAN